MTLDPILYAPLAVQLHVATVIPAALIGAFMLVARKGTPLHKRLGRIWLGLMALTALSTFFIHEINLFAGFSPIHLLSVLVLAGCMQVVRTARRRQFKAHMRVVKSMYFGGISIAGLFTLMPGRIMNAIVFGRAAESGAPAIMPLMIGLFAALALAAGIMVFLRRRHMARLRGMPRQRGNRAGSQSMPVLNRTAVSGIEWVRQAKGAPRHGLEGSSPERQY